MNTVAWLSLGFIQISNAGIYNFNLASDDGGRLYVGNPADRCKVIALGRRSTPELASFESSPAPPQSGRWTWLEGEVTFAGQNDIGMELELTCGTESVETLVVGGLPAGTANQLLHRHVRLEGVCDQLNDPDQKTAARMVVPSPDQFQIQDLAGETNAAPLAASNAILTTARQVQRLKPEQARKKLPVKVKGIITQSSPSSVVLQDATGGVFINYSSRDWMNQPRVGDLWELEGRTDPGDFSPVIYATRGKYQGHATLPEPVRPTWDQLMNGSLDAQFVEIRGVVISVAETGMEILTADGKVNVSAVEMRRFYADGQEVFVTIQGRLDQDAVSQSYVGSVVRIRGCVAAVWNSDTRQVSAGEIRLVAAVVSVEDPAPADPFVLPTRRVADLLLFDPRASTLQRTKVTGQVVYARTHEFLLQTGPTGFRALSETPQRLHAGDLVEAVGFPQLGGPSPVLLAAQLRKTGTGPLPVPFQVSDQDLQNDKLDSTVVQIEAVLLSDTFNRGERILELQK